MVQQDDGQDMPAIYLKSCPATQPERSVPALFTEQVVDMVKGYYSRIAGKDVRKVLIVNPTLRGMI